MPKLLHDHGGLVFLLLYCLCLFVVALPICIAEVSTGLFGRSNYVANLRKFAQYSQASKFWSIIGYSGSLLGILIVIGYSLIGSWILFYIWQILEQRFVNLSQVESQLLFSNLTESIHYRTLFFTIFLGLMTVLLSTRIRVALGYFATVALVLIIVALAAIIYATFDSGTTYYYFNQGFDFSFLNYQTLFAALNHALLTLLIGVGVMSTFASYLPKSQHIFRSCTYIIGIDIIISILASLAIAIFSTDINTDIFGGVDFIFVQIPHFISILYGGQLVALLFYVAVFMVIATTVIALLEPIVAHAESVGIDRRMAAPLLGVFFWILIWIFFLRDNSGFTKELWLSLTLFDWLQFISRQILLPINTFLIALFIGYFVSIDRLRQLFITESELAFEWWYLLVRTIAIAAAFIILLYNIL